MELSMLFGVIVLFGASIALTTIVRLAVDASDDSQTPWSDVGSLFWFAAGFIVPWILTFMLILLAYWLVPNANNSLSDVWIAAALVSFAIEILKSGYAIYVVNFSSYGDVYGALGGILLFMFFVWLSSYAFLIGAELASEYPRVMRGDYGDESSQPAGRFNLRDTIVGPFKSLFVADGDD